MSENTTKILYTQHELLFMFQQDLRNNLNARYPFEPDFKDANFQLETSTEWYDSQTSFDQYEITPELRTMITLTELENGYPTGNKLTFMCDHNSPYAKLTEFPEIPYEIDEDGDPIYSPEQWSTYNGQPAPFHIEVSFNGNGLFAVKSPFKIEQCYGNTANENVPVYNDSYVTDYIKPYFIDYPKQLQRHLQDFEIGGISDSFWSHFGANDNMYGSNGEAIIYRAYPRANPNLDYYQEPYYLCMEQHNNPNHTLTFTNKLLPTPKKQPQKFSCDINNNFELRALNDTLVAVSQRTTSAQEEIAYQVALNNRYERHNDNKLSKYHIVPTLPDTLQGTNTVQVTVTSEDTSKDFFVTRINADQYRITEPFDPNNLPDSIDVYSVVTRTKDEGYSKTLGNELKRIVVNDRKPRNSIRVAKQKPKVQQRHFDEPEDNGPSLD